MPLFLKSGLAVACSILNGSPSRGLLLALKSIPPTQQMETNFGDISRGRGDTEVAKNDYEADMLRLICAETFFLASMTASREIYERSCFSLGQAEKQAIDQAVLNSISGNYSVLTPEWLGTPLFCCPGCTKKGRRFSAALSGSMPAGTYFVQFARHKASVIPRRIESLYHDDDEVVKCHLFTV